MIWSGNFTRLGLAACNCSTNHNKINKHYLSCEIITTTTIIITAAITMNTNEWMFNGHPSTKNRSAIGCQKKVNAWNGYIIKKWKVLKKHSLKSCAINKILEFSSVKILNKMQNLLKIFKLIQGGEQRKQTPTRSSRSTFCMRNL